MNFSEIKERDDRYLAGTYARHPVAFVKGAGARLFGADGREYIDFASGIGVASLGYGDADWARAVADQAASLAHTSNLFYSEPCGAAAEKLCTLSGAKKVFFGNSGAEANEGMIKAARKYSFDRYGKDRSTIVTLRDSFHGRTVTTLEATGQDVFHNFFFPFGGGFRYAAANDAADVIAQLSRGDVCALMMESVQGEGGVTPLDAGFVQEVCAYAREHDILILFDEVQTGIGRTGAFFGYQQLGVEPDLVSAAKGLGGGLPIGAVLFFEKCADVLGPSQHGSTFGGNPVACAGAAVVLDKVGDPHFLEGVAAKGAALREALEAIDSPCIREVRGRGLMLGLGLSDRIAAKDLCAKLLENGLVTLTAGKNTLRLLPPLVLSDRDITEGVSILRGVLASI